MTAHPPALRERVLTLAAAGVVSPSIGDHVGLSEGAVRAIVVRAGRRMSSDRSAPMAVNADGSIVDPHGFHERVEAMRQDDPDAAYDYLLGLVEDAYHIQPLMSLTPWGGMRLTGNEARLLHHLDWRKGGLATRPALLTAITQAHADHQPEIKLVDVIVCHLRRKLRDAQAPWRIETVWGQGYRLVALGLETLRWTE